MRFPQSEFCISHTCRVCLEVSAPPYCKPVLSEVPRNVCTDHTLCAFVYPSGNTCLRVASEGNSYCDKHDGDHEVTPKKAKAPIVKGDGRCWGINNRKKRCGTRGSVPDGSRWYCPAHVGQDPEKEDADDEEDAEDYEAEEAEVRNTLLSRQPEVDILVHWVQCAAESRRGRCPMRKLDPDHASFRAAWLCPMHAEAAEPSIPSDAQSDRKESSSTHLDESVSPQTDQGEALVNEGSSPTIAGPVVRDVAMETDKETPAAENFDDDEAMLDAEEAVAGDIHPDELDMDDFELAEESNDNVARLREIYAEDDANEGESSDDESIGMRTVDSASKFLGDVLREMSWSASWTRRMATAAEALHCCVSIIDSLRERAEDHVAEGRIRRLEAGAAGFKASELIGATVVGASRRLDAIRAAEPFAVLVEEACEVMEPTLVSVLAVKSLRKLELIGDHRQLPAFVQPCWYNFERTAPGIKISLFERLITDYSGNEVDGIACTILDEQRRMRSEIADITREDYVDVVAIKDHPKTETQRIGDHLPGDSPDLKAFNRHKELWSKDCLHSPGVGTNIFFWDVKNNAEGRPIAGLSACNYVEASYVVQLTSWLLLCGVPSSSISIITPYKGQKTLLLRELRKAHCIPQFDKKLGGYPDEGVMVNTVDRYQGDENDIIILSLVRTSPGNRFIGLENRFIVATSRARLAFFVIGSINAVMHRDKTLKGDGPQHWRRFVTSLSSDRGGGPPKVGERLEICCPRHSNTSLSIAGPTEFPRQETWADFCNLPCRYALPECGHQCQERCHSPLQIPHTKKCVSEIPRPCAEHVDVPLLCHQARGNHATLAQGLEKFECEVPMSYERAECSHRVEVQCHVFESLLAGRLALEPCEEPVADYVHPACGHVRKKMKCKFRLAFEKAPPKCMVQVSFVKVCGCKTKLACYDMLQEKENPTACKNERTIARPRCGHPISMRCFQCTSLLSEWDKLKAIAAKTEDGMAVVEIGTVYGPSESSYHSFIQKCMGPAKLELVCGHEIPDLTCDFAFQCAADQRKIPRCEAEVAVESPICSHKVKVPCFVLKLIEDVLPLEMIEGEDCHYMKRQCLESCEWKQLPTPVLNALQIVCSQCTQCTIVIPLCDPSHHIKIRCNEILDYILRKKLFKDCKYEHVRRLTCGHDRRVPCYTRQHREPPCRAKVDDVLCYPCGEHKYFPGTCSNLKAFRNEEEQGRVICPEVVEAIQYRCGHPVRVPCFKKSYVVEERIGKTIEYIEGVGEGVVSGHVYCEAPVDIQPCSHTPVAFKRSCSHMIPDLPCTKAFEYAIDESLAPICVVPSQMVSPLCGHLINPACHLHTPLSEWRPWADDELPKFGQVVQRDGSVMEVLDCSSRELKLLPLGVTKSDVDCGTPVVYIRECGNHELRISCCQAFLEEIPPCSEEVVSPH